MSQQDEDMGRCLVCQKRIGTGSDQCSPEPNQRCYEKEGRSQFSVSLQMAELAGATKVQIEHRSKLARLLTAVLNYEHAPSEYKERLGKRVIEEACDLFKDDEQANELRAWASRPKEAS